MIFALSLVGKALAGAAASEVGAASGSETTSARKSGNVAQAADFTQTVDKLDPAAAAAASAALHGVFPDKG